MLNPIKRVWVPKSAAATLAPQAAAPTPAPAPVASPPPEPTPMNASAAAPASKRGMFDETPEVEVSEKFSDSVWAEFDSVIPQNTK